MAVGMVIVTFVSGLSAARLKTTYHRESVSAISGDIDSKTLKSLSSGYTRCSSQGYNRTSSDKDSHSSTKYLRRTLNVLSA